MVFTGIAELVLNTGILLLRVCLPEQKEKAARRAAFS
jgi:hypothetical protein